MLLCPHCQSVLADNSSFCNHCGQQMQARPQSEPEYTPEPQAPPPPAQVSKGIPGSIIVIVIVFFCVVVGIFVSIIRNDGQTPATQGVVAPSTPSPTVDEGPQEYRNQLANSVSRSLRENGCVSCSAYAAKTVFVIKTPDYAPKVTAALILSNAQVKAKLVSAGFDKLRVYQDTSFLGDYFEYDIK
jgi:hypothetical protein